MEDRNAESAIAFGATTLRNTRKTVEAELEEIYDRYAESMFRYAHALTGSAEDAEDTVQEVFARIVREIGRLRRVTSIRAYLFAATRNAAYTILRSRRRKGEVEQAIAVKPETCWTANAEIGSVEDTALREAFARLPVEQREVLALKVFDGLTFREIAETTGASINTVASRYRYAIDRLRHALEVDGDG